MIKIAQIYRAANGTQEPFELEFSAEELLVPEIEGPVIAQGNFLRVEEGIMMLIQELKTTQVSPCSRCAKLLKIPLDFKPSEWLFYEEPPVEGDDENEHLQMDTHRLELNPQSPIRQDLILNLEQAPHCEKPCKKYEEALPGDEGVKALSSLKSLLP